LKNTSKKSSFSLWRKIHIYSFGYFKWASILVSTIFVFIAITGVLYNHLHDFSILEKGRISTSFLPNSYQERLDKTRKAQGLENLFPEEANRMPVMWLVIDLHTGAFFGSWGRIFYDFVALSLIMLSISGCYLLLKIRARKTQKPKGDS
jgi:uncharacterized iron-regulated membrane protein